MSNDSTDPIDEPLLRATRLTKRFGGLAAVSDVSLELRRNRIHAVIGPNGAGKSTLANLLSGELVPTSGTVMLAGKDVTGWAPERISRSGLGRSYQKTNIFLPFTVWENIRLAAQSRTPHALAWLKRASSVTETNERAQRRPRGPARCGRRHREPRRTAPARNRDDPGRRSAGAAAR